MGDLGYAVRRWRRRARPVVTVARWHRIPRAMAVEDPTAVGVVVRELERQVEESAYLRAVDLAGDVVIEVAETGDDFIRDTRTVLVERRGVVMAHAWAHRLYRRWVSRG